MNKLIIGFLRPISSKTEACYKALALSEMYIIQHGEYVDLTSLEKYFTFISECDLIIIDKEHDYPLQVSGVINDCISLGKIPVTYKSNRYWTFIANVISIKPIYIEDLPHICCDQISRQYIRDYKKATLKYLETKREENKARCASIMRENLNRLYISFNGKASTGGFIDLYRIAINEIINNDYDVRILARSRSFDTETIENLPKHFSEFWATINTRYSTITDLFIHRRHSTILFVMPSTKDVLLLILIKWAFPRVTIYTVVHNSRSHVSSINRLKRNCAFMFQRIFYYHADMVLFLSKEVKKSWKSLSNSSIYRIPIISQGSAISISKHQTLGEKYITLVIIGRWLPYKSLDLLSSSLAHLPISRQIRIQVAGNGYPEDEINRLKLVCSKKAITFSHTNTFIGLRAAEDLIKAASYTCFLYTEASQSGFMHLCKELKAPIICTKVGALQENLKVGGIGFCIKPKDYLIARLLSNINRISTPPSYKIHDAELPRLANLRL